MNLKIIMVAVAVPLIAGCMATGSKKNTISNKSAHEKAIKSFDEKQARLRDKKEKAKQFATKIINSHLKILKSKTLFNKREFAPIPVGAPVDISNTNIKSSHCNTFRDDTAYCLFDFNLMAKNGNTEARYGLINIRVELANVSSDIKEIKKEPGYGNRKFINEVKKLFYEANPFANIPKKYKKYIKVAQRRSIVVGMPEDLLYIAWGKPEKVNRYVSSHRNTNQLVYSGHSQYVYLKNGRISSFQSFGN